MSVVFGKLHGVKSSKSVTFNSFVGLRGNEASYVKRDIQQQHHNDNDECSDGRSRGHEVVSVDRGGVGGVPTGQGTHGGRQNLRDSSFA